ncbi:glutathione S-transferase family protein [Mesorhizobium plurifarium]|uniref:glutathione S-transferase family protein n=1 Tax=Sinorhizobium arboris TaxID=76745 RepID=UPI000414047B|nr:glutathione S-transferase family protein [Sinorhizobium arboris]PST24705.1 glutathione S-transferase family protein [Mesorhizobium plurifarium]
MTEKPRLFGADYSVYVRIVRLVLVEKGIDYELVPVDIFRGDGPPADYLERQPFGRIPAFEHEGFSLYETGAITRYVDDVFEGRKLQPSDPRERARCNQLLSIADNYAYPAMVWGIYVERVSKPARGDVADEAAISAALLKARICMGAISGIMGTAPWLAGEAMSLADLYLTPIFDYVLKAPEGQEMLRQHENLEAWWARMSVRPSVKETQPS